MNINKKSIFIIFILTMMFGLRAQTKKLDIDPDELSKKYQKALRNKDCSHLYKVRGLSRCSYHILNHYRQVEYNPIDPIGDFVMLEGFRLRVLEKKRLVLGDKKLREYLRYSLLDEDNRESAHEILGLDLPHPPEYAKNIPPFDHDNLLAQVERSNLPDTKKAELIKNPSLVNIEGKIRPLRPKRIVEMFVQVINEERVKKRPECSSMEPVYGVEPKWSKKNPYIKNFSLHSFSKIWSKLLIALALGETNAYMYVGVENDLRSWIKSQADRSISFESIFRKSYQLNCGDVAKTLMAILNTLSEHYRFPNRQQLVQTTKLSPIINYLGNDVDVFGPWYHFFGLVLYSYHRSKIKGEVYAFIERGTALFYDEQNDKQENYMHQALYVGKELRKILKKKSYQDYPNRPEVLSTDYYLNLSEDFTKALEKEFN